MTPETCRADPLELEPGAIVFRVANRTRRPRTFTIAGRRTAFIQPRRSGALRLELDRTGVYRFFCVSHGPHAMVRTGVVAVRSLPAVPPPPAPTDRISGS